MTLTETLDHLLSVFLRPLRTWIEQFVLPLRAAYDAAMQTKEQYRDGVYLHLKERLEGTDEHPLAEGVPVRPLPATQDLAHLQAAVELLADRKIEGASPDIPDGVSLVRLLCDSSLASQVTEIVDTNKGYAISSGSNPIESVLSRFTNLTRLVIGCKSVTTQLTYQYTTFSNIEEIIFPHLDTIADIPILPSPMPNAKVVLPVLETCNMKSNYFPLFHSKEIEYPAFKKGAIRLGGSGAYANKETMRIYLGCKGERTDVIHICDSAYGNQKVRLEDLELRDGAKQPIILDSQTSYDKYPYLTAENIVNHILNRLADNNDGDPITITLGSTNLAKLTDEEKHIAIDKNYILA